MRAILINPVTCQVIETEYSGTYTDIYTMCDFELFDCIELGDGQTMYVDDEALLKDNQFFFRYDGFDQPIGGKVLIIGTDENGDAVGTTLDIDELKNKIEFVGKLTRIV